MIRGKPFCGALFLRIASMKFRRRGNWYSKRRPILTIRILNDYLEGNRIDADRLKGALAQGTTACLIFPVLLGSALRNKGIQPLLDAVADFLPSPCRLPLRSVTVCRDDEPETIPCDPNAPFCALAFKVLSEEGKKLTFLRIYAGSIQAGAQVLNSTRSCHERCAQLFRMHAHKRERITAAYAGDIIAALGLKEVLTGDTLCDPAHPVVLESLAVPEPVVSLAVEPKGVEDREKLLPALEKLQWEDPTFRVREDPETGQTILNGMGELHLEIITTGWPGISGYGSRPGRRKWCTGKP